MLNVWLRVGKKTPSHPFAKKGGSDNAYFYLLGPKKDRESDSFREGSIELVAGNKYRFHIEESNHPMYFTTNEAGGSGMPGALKMFGNVGVSSGYIDLELDDVFIKHYGSMPIYYNCARHFYMGGRIMISHPTMKLAQGFAKLNSKTEMDMERIPVPKKMISPLFATSMEGTIIRYQDKKDAKFMLSIHEYDRDVGIGILGGFFYSGSRHQHLKGCYLFADYSGKIYALRPVRYKSQETSSGWTRELLHVFDARTSLQEVGKDDNGEFYVMGNEEGLEVLYALGGSIHESRINAATRLGDELYNRLPELRIKQKDDYDPESLGFRGQDKKIIDELSRLKVSVKELEAKIDNLKVGGGTFNSVPVQSQQPPFDWAKLISALKTEQKSSPTMPQQNQRRRVEIDEGPVKAEDRPTFDKPKGTEEKGKFVDEIIALAASEDGVKSIMKSKPMYASEGQMEQGMKRDYERAKEVYRQSLDKWDQEGQNGEKPKPPTPVPPREEIKKLWTTYLKEAKEIAQEVIKKLPVDLESAPEKFAPFYSDQLKKGKKKKIIPNADFDVYWESKYINPRKSNPSFEPVYKEWIKDAGNKALYDKAKGRALQLAKIELDNWLAQDVKPESSLKLELPISHEEPGGGPPPPPPPP